VKKMRCQGCGVVKVGLSGPLCGECRVALHEVLAEVVAELRSTPVEQRVMR